MYSKQREQPETVNAWNSKKVSVVEAEGAKISRVGMQGGKSCGALSAILGVLALIVRWEATGEKVIGSHCRMLNRKFHIEKCFKKIGSSEVHGMALIERT